MFKLGLGPRRDILQPLPVNEVFRDVVTVLRSIAPESKPSERQDVEEKLMVREETKLEVESRSESGESELREETVKVEVQEEDEEDYEEYSSESEDEELEEVSADGDAGEASTDVRRVLTLLIR